MTMIPGARRTRLFGLAVAATLLLVGGAQSAVAEESWDAIYTSGSRVGYIHTFIAQVKDKGRTLLRVRVDMKITLKRQNDRSTIETRYGTIETLDGEVLRLDTRTLASNQELRAFGDVIDGKMLLTLEGTGQRQQITIPWSPDVRGPYAAEQSLSRKAMTVGEARSLRMFMPDLNKICDVTLTAERMEEVTLGGGKRPLMRVAQTTQLDGAARPEFDVVLWVDNDGQVLKSETTNMGGLVTYRTTREAATAPITGQLNANLILTSIIRTSHKIPKPDATRDIVYRVTLKDDNPSAVFPSDRRQAVSAGSTAGEARIEVKTAGPNDGEAGPATVDEKFLRPNTLITSEDFNVQELAAKAVGAAQDPWERAVRIVRWVARNVRDKNFETAFASASEVAQTLAGDCTEHSVLAAAMCRAMGIPARVAVGLVYADHLNGFGFHMWNEVYVNRRWVALDAAFDQSSVDAVHLKLSDTSLDGVSPFEAFLPVARVMGRLSIDPVEIRPVAAAADASPTRE